MPDSPAPAAHANLDVHANGDQSLTGIVVWPSPPFASYPGPMEMPAPVACMVQGLNGRIARSQLIGLDFEAGIARFKSSTVRTPIVLRFDQFLSLTLTEPLAPERGMRTASTQGSALLQRRPRTPYRLLLKGGQSVTGLTVGSIERECGLFLFPPVDDRDRVIRMFVPRDACLRRDLGAPIGKVLIEQQAASPEQVEQVVALQEEMRSQKLGELLVKQQIVAPEELLKALELQSRTPVMRVGEALMALGMITQEQLDAVLDLQKSDRSVPLGELLVRQKMISPTDLRNALARKMGYPIVDVTHFPVEAGALRRVPFAVAQRLHVLPLVLSESTLVVGIDDVTRRVALEELEFVSQLKVVPALASLEEIDAALGTAYSRIGSGPGAGAEDGAPAQDGGEEVKDVGKLAESLERDGGELPRVAEDAPIEQSDNSLVRLINQMIVEAHNEGASDIHIECYPGLEKVKIRFRKDGTLRPYLELPHNYRNAIVSRIKIMCDLDISERRKPQDGKIDFSRHMARHKLELRVATIPTSNGLEDVVMRLLASAKPIPLDGLGLSPRNLAPFKSMIERPYGLILCVGPTGSGKTTTLHSALGHINQPERKIWTAEDPVEITQPGLRQVQVNAKIDWTFARALRAFLRADPDVIMVGEVRDEETAQMVVEASLTGHLVFSTLHTNTAPETVTRLLDMGLDVFNFSDALLGVLAQRLVRALCRHCRVASPATDHEIEEMLADYRQAAIAAAVELPRETLLADWHARFAVDGRLMHYDARGCAHCGNSGLRGRVGIHELMSCDYALRDLIQKRVPVAELRAQALRSGMRTLRQDGIEKVLQGLTSLEEVRSTSNEG